MTRTLDRTHTVLSYLEGSLKNAIIIDGTNKECGFIFSLLNPPVPLGGNIVGMDIYVDELPIQKKSILIATSDDVVNAALLTESRPISFKPFQSARFLISGIDLVEGKRHKIVILSKLEGFEQIIIPFTFSDTVRNKKERVVIPTNILDESNIFSSGEDTIFTNFTGPLILSGRKAYIVCSSNASLSANWTWMGARYDNGGLYVPPARAFGRIIVEVSVDDGVRKRLPNFVVASRHEAGILYTRHEVAGIQVKRTLFVPTNSKGFIMKLEFYSDKSSADLGGLIQDSKSPARRKIRVHFMIDGNITSYGLAAISQSNVSKYYKSENCLQIRTLAKKEVAHYYGTIGIAPGNLKPTRVLTDSFDNDLELSYDLVLEEDLTKEIALIGAGSFTSPRECLQEYKFMRENYPKLLEDTREHFVQFSAHTLSINSSSDAHPLFSKLIRAFEKAKNSLEYLKADYDKLGAGISAGLPRFPNYWARDTGWSLRGYLSLGEYHFALQVIENFLKHQAKPSSKNASRGELPMIISGKSFLHSTTYGSADSTFLFPWAIRQYVYGTGDLQYLEKRWKSIKDLINWGFLKDIDHDGLVEHGFFGTAEKLPIQDSTWMDHIDRRKNANDVQGLFYESLVTGSELAKMACDEDSQKKWSAAAAKLKLKIDKEYWEPKMEYYYDTIRRDGSKDGSIRPNSLILLLSGAVSDHGKIEAVLNRIEREDVTTPWGIRTLSSLDPKYHPSLYHDGAVWPLVTGWAAVCETRYCRPEKAIMYLSSMADRILSENGMFAETYRGDKAEPFNSCILQAWSVGMYVYALREIMLGERVNIIDNAVTFNPQIPTSLKSSSTQIIFEDYYHGPKGRVRVKIEIHPDSDKILIHGKEFSGILPEFTSNNYSVKIV
ncbi:MAG: amylo-alpha-1,6-glucosidase [Candidatus Eiseniibacteriota bacterium]